MHPRTKATLAELTAAAWFRRVGEPVEGPFVPVKSWDEAIEQCSSLAWENLSLEAANRYREAVLKRSPERYQQWNTIADELRPVVVAFVDRQTRATIEKHGLPKVFKDRVNWDIMHLCMEAEYADVFPPGFFASQAYWYVQGHFPCGWEGKFPVGKLVLY